MSIAFIAFVVACGARTEHPSSPPPSPPPSPMDRFVEVLRDGHSLYGLGAGCDEWRAQPGDAEIQIQADGEAADDDDAPDGDAPDERDDVQPAAPRNANASSLEGSLTAHADREGRIYEFAYQVDLAKAPLRMKITGRGGWHPAPGVVIRRPDGNAIIGVGSYCIAEVDVRTDPDVQDAVFVGSESWFLTHDACVRSTRRGQGLQHSPHGCSK